MIIRMITIDSNKNKKDNLMIMTTVMMVDLDRESILANSGKTVPHRYTSLPWSGTNTTPVEIRTSSSKLIHEGCEYEIHAAFGGVVLQPSAYVMLLGLFVSNWNLSTMFRVVQRCFVGIWNSQFVFVTTRDLWRRWFWPNSDAGYYFVLS